MRLRENIRSVNYELQNPPDGSYFVKYFMFLIIGRTFKEGLRNFWRNGSLSFASVSVLILCLFSVSALMVVLLGMDNLLKDVQEKISVSVYFKSETAEEKIMEVKKELEGYAEVRTVDYVDKDQALENFTRNNSNQPVIMQSLKELGGNPLLDYLVIKADAPDRYDMIIGHINDSSYRDDVSRINYGKNKETIDNLNLVTGKIRKSGIFLIGFFALVSVLIIFNTIRLTIHSHKQEIEVMRLVGASNTYIRLPFIFEGVVSGTLAALFSMGALYGVILLISSYAEKVVPSQNLLLIYSQNVAWIFLIQWGAGVFLGILSGLAAIRRYLKI